MLRVVLLVCALALQGCGSRPAGVRVENHSFARPDEVVVEHIDLDLTVDFENRRISGHASLRIVNKRGARRLDLDTRSLNINKVTLGDGRETRFVLGDEVGVVGRPLTVDILPETKVVNVFYETTDGATGLDWLSPAQTAGGERPFLFTQGQAILNRTWIPCQDHPGVRVTYNARITTPPGVMAVMSSRNGTTKRADGVYEFSMPQPIPAYLIALAVGDLEFREISERCGVYAEPSLVEQAAWEFADTEAMIQTAEALYGPYRWERYDIIVLPPSFPYGGMENPRLSFVTPVLLAGDRSLVSTIAHELAHSWSGNLVTNATWNDFWLNEGFTTYFELRILEALYGTERMELQALLGYEELRAAISELGADNPDTRLRLDISQGDPDEGLSTVAYEKGYLFLRLLEETVGREKWDAFLRGYFDHFAFQSMTTGAFLDYMRERLFASDPGLERRVRVEEWVYGTGIPDNHPVLRSSAFEHVKAQIRAFETGTAPAALETAGWSTQEWKLFIKGLPDDMSADQMRALDEHFDFTGGTNAELLQVWFLHGIESRYRPVYPRLEDYLTGIGRIWLISPLYRKLAESPEGLEMAKQIYRKARPGYHALTAAIMDKVVGWKKPEQR
ncbi:MAG: M1 family metallopeptidase [Candidatus Krumholzibacteriia bacterium]